jgi:DNA-binding MarR family transcriptional regulator
MNAQDAAALHREPDLATERLRLWLQMLKAVRSVEGLLRDRLREGYGMTLPRFDVMATLYGNPEGLRMSVLSRQLVVSNGNVTGLVERLVADGLVRRDNVESDRRAWSVRLTDEGRALMDAVIADHRDWVDAALGDVGEADVARAMAVMLAIRHRDRDGGSA